MLQNDMQRKRRLLEELAAELGVRLNKAKGTRDQNAKFRAQRFRILADTAERFDNIMQGSVRLEYNLQAENLVNDYWDNHLDRTKKSDKGGARKGYTDIVKCGKGAVLILDGLQSRIDYWQAYHDHIDSRETAVEQAQRRALANRYLKQRDAKKHFGRPARSINGIVIEGLTGGAPLESYVSAMARYFLEHGECVLTNEFLDAVLDNGGLRPNEREASSGLLELIDKCNEIIEENSLPQDALCLVKKALAILEGKP